MNNKKNILSGLIISIILLIISVAITFATYIYSRSGTSNSKQIVGDIYMHYNESTELSLSNAMPREDYMENKYFQFTIDGKNTNTKNDIYYDIILSHGDVPNGKTESNRIDDKFLRFRLVEVVSGNEEEIFPDRVYSDLTNKRIHVETIPKNTNSEVTHTYRLYMWIGYNVIIGNTDNANYSDTEWSNLFASIKVNVTGDFNEKTIDTPSECFTTELTETDPYVNPELTNNELQTCISYFNNDLGYIWDTGEDATSFCNGTGTHDGNTFQNELDNSSLNSYLDYLLNNNIVKKDQALMITDYDASCGSDVVIPSRMNYTTYSNATLNTSMTNEEIQTCVNYLTSEWGAEVEGDTVDVGETYQAFCNGTGTNWGDTFQSGLDNNWFNSNQMNYFLNNNIITANVSSSKLSVVSIYGNRDECSFCSKNLINVVIPNTITEIGNYAFQDNQLTYVNIPNSVKNINIYAFSYNQLTNVIIGNNVKGIYASAFENNQLTEIFIPDSVTIIGPDAFSNNPITRLNLGNGIHTSFNGSYGSNGMSISAFDFSKINYIDKEIIDSSLFEYVSPKLTGNLTLGNSVTSIGNSAFSNNQLTNVTIGNSVTSIGNYAFFANQLTSVTIPSSVTSIGSSAFSNNQLTSVTIPSSVTTIDSWAFSGNNQLTSISIDKTCSSLRNMSEYPWLGSSQYYTGTTIYGSNNEVCDTFPAS